MNTISSKCILTKYRETVITGKCRGSGLFIPHAVIKKCPQFAGKIYLNSGSKVISRYLLSLSYLSFYPVYNLHRRLKGHQ